MNSKNPIVPRNRPLVFSVVMVLILLIGCDSSTDSGNDEDRVQFEDGISVDVKELLGDELLNIIENDLEMPIHRGDSPPDIASLLADIDTTQQSSDVVSETSEITIIKSPNVLLKSNVPNDVEPGATFLDLYMRVKNQDFDNYTIDLDQMHLGREASRGPGSFIIGEGNQFTIVGAQRQVFNQDTVLTANIFSGTISDQGISAHFTALVMIDNRGLSGYIPNNTGRSFIDGDGIATLATWPGDQAQAPTASSVLENQELKQIRNLK